MFRILQLTTLTIASASLLFFSACERHTLEETKWFSQGHGHADDASHAADASHNADESHEGAPAQAQEHSPKKFISH